MEIKPIAALGVAFSRKYHDSQWQSSLMHDCLPAALLQIDEKFTLQGSASLILSLPWLPCRRSCMGGPRQPHTLETQLRISFRQQREPCLHTAASSKKMRMGSKMTGQNKAGVLQKVDLFFFPQEGAGNMASLSNECCTISSSQPTLEIRNYFRKPFEGQELSLCFVSLAIGCSILFSAQEEIFLRSVSSQKSPDNRLCNRLEDKASLMKAGLLWLSLKF